MALKTASRRVRSVIDLEEACRSGATTSDDWIAFNRIFKVTMSSSRMAIPKPFEAKIARWFKLPTDESEEEATERAQNQTVGECRWLVSNCVP